MHFLETIDFIRERENENNELLEKALSISRYYDQNNAERLRRSEAWYLPAVNSRARIKWASAWLSEMHKCFGAQEDDEVSRIRFYLITIADRAHLFDAGKVGIDFRSIRRKLGGALQGLNYVGMIEPGYFNAIYDRDDVLLKNKVSWHGHFLVWGTSRAKLERWRRKRGARIACAIPHRCSIHIKRLRADQLGHRVGYINKSPSREYSVGRRKKLDRLGRPRYKQNSRALRAGHRVALFKALINVTLPELAMAGGEGQDLMRRIKYVALEEARRKR